MKNYKNFVNMLGGDFKNSADQVKKFLKKEKNIKKFLDGLNDKKHNDDRINISENEVLASDLKPSQQQVFLDKAISEFISNKKFRKQALKGFIYLPTVYITKDNHILDGHHRWAAVYILNPNCIIKCLKIDLTIKGAIPIFNTIMQIEEPEDQFKTGKDKYNIFNINKKKDFKEVLDDIIENGYDEDEIKLPEPKKMMKKPKKLYNIIIDSEIGVEYNLKDKKDVVKYLFNNMTELPVPKKIFGNREQMPQLGKHEDVMKKAKDGVYNINDNW